MGSNLERHQARICGVCVWEVIILMPTCVLLTGPTSDRNFRVLYLACSEGGLSYFTGCQSTVTSHEASLGTTEK
eukprot:2718701-Pyramimonas_sp.AAC.1